MSRFALTVCFYAVMSVIFFATALPAQTYKPLPPPGIELPAEARRDLQSRLDQLHSLTDQAVNGEATLRGEIVQIQVLLRAVELALGQDLFFKIGEVKDAHRLLDEAEDRLERLRKGMRGLRLLGMAESPVAEPQFLVGGFRSNLDDSVQPFGLVVPGGYVADESPVRVDVWLHGRGDTKTEIPFLTERMTKPGQYIPADTFVLHPFGRHCNAFKFAGEVDVDESIEHLAMLIPIDRDRLSIRGFSMGGAGCWHLAVHQPGRWMAANPGAGFVDTLVYQGWTDRPPFELDDTRRKLLLWYDVLPWVRNLKNTNVVAYSGEIDKQKQAADRVVEAAKLLQIPIQYVIGKGMGHKINNESADEISRTIAAWAQQERPSPRRVIDFVTYTLRYPQVDWVRITGIAEHWKESLVHAELRGEDQVTIRTRGVTQLRLDFHESGQWEGVDLKVDIDGDRLLVSDQSQGRGFSCELIRDNGWFVLEGPDALVRKRPGMQGPIDDAFCDRFLFVLPSRPATHGPVERWVGRELRYAKQRWQRLMRGEIREVLDTELTDEQIAENHLICFGDFQSNQYLRSIQSQLPIRWTDTELSVGSQEFDPAQHAAVFCYPNPRNSSRYVVANSGMTFREFSNVSNSRQIAMLPDWAVIDVRGDDGMLPGRVARDGFFDENWRIQPSSR